MNISYSKDLRFVMEVGTYSATVYDCLDQLKEGQCKNIFDHKLWTGSNSECGNGAEEFARENAVAPIVVVTNFPRRGSLSFMKGEKMVLPVKSAKSLLL